MTELEEFELRCLKCKLVTGVEIHYVKKDIGIVITRVTGNAIRKLVIPSGAVLIESLSGAKCETLVLEGFAKLGYNCCSANKYIKHVICDTVHIGEQAFMHCENLISFDAKKIVYLGEMAFWVDKNLSYFNFSSLQSYNIFPLGVFRSCAFESLDLSMFDLVDLRDGCFQNNTKLKSIKLPEKTYFHVNCFRACTVLELVKIEGVLNQQYGLHCNIFDFCNKDVRIEINKSNSKNLMQYIDNKGKVVLEDFIGIYKDDSGSKKSFNNIIFK